MGVTVNRACTSVNRVPSGPLAFLYGDFEDKQSYKGQTLVTLPHGHSLAELSDTRTRNVLGRRGPECQVPMVRT